MFLTLVRCTNLSPTALTEVGNFECSNLAQFSRTWEESLPNDCFNYCRVSGQVRRFRFNQLTPTKLWEGNVFIRVYLFIHKGSPYFMWPLLIMHWASLQGSPTLPWTSDMGPPPKPRPHPASRCQTWNYPLSPAPPLPGTSVGHNWGPVQFFFTWTPPLPPYYWHLTADAHVIVKKAVPILLEWFIVFKISLHVIEIAITSPVGYYLPTQNNKEYRHETLFLLLTDVLWKTRSALGLECSAELPSVSGFRNSILLFG